MVFDKGDDTESHQELSSEQVSGARIGIGIVAVMSICIILGLTLPVFFPHAYERLRAIAYMITGSGDDQQTDDDD